MKCPETSEVEHLQEPGRCRVRILDIVAERARHQADVAEVIVSPDWREDKQIWHNLIAPRGWAKPEPVAEMSRRDGTIVAWHEVPAPAPPRTDRPGGDGVSASRRQAAQPLAFSVWRSHSCVRSRLAQLKRWALPSTEAAAPR
jgi:hypothetical protein